MGVCVVKGAAGREVFVRMLLCSVGGGEKGEEDGDDEEVEDETPHTRSQWSVTI